MRCRPILAFVAIVLAASACGSSAKSTRTLPETPGTVGPRASASEATRSTALIESAIRDLARGRTDLAKGEFKAAVAHNSNNKFGWYNLGAIASKAKNVSEASTDYEHAITIDPHFEPALYNYGILLFSGNDLDPAINYLDRAVQANDKDANAHWSLGLALAQRNNGTDNQRSTVELNKALKLNPALAASGVRTPATSAP